MRGYAYSAEEFAESFDDEEREDFRRGGRYDVTLRHVQGRAFVCRRRKAAHAEAKSALQIWPNIGTRRVGRRRSHDPFLRKRREVLTVGEHYKEFREIRPCQTCGHRRRVKVSVWSHPGAQTPTEHFAKECSVCAMFTRARNHFATAAELAIARAARSAPS
jgi:hypothetical protein